MLGFSGHCGLTIERAGFSNFLFAACGGEKRREGEVFASLHTASKTVYQGD